MKPLLLLTLILGVSLIGFLVMLSSNNIYAMSTFPDSIKIGERATFSLKMSNLGGDYISNIEPIITIMPKRSIEFVHVNINPQTSALYDGFYQISHGSIYVDKDIPDNRIFVSVSFMGKNSLGEQVTLSPDSTFNASIKIEKEFPISDSMFDLEKPSCTGSDTLYGCHETKTVKINSPLQQFRSGLAPADVVCKPDLILILKASDASPACVKPKHSGRLLSDGWFSVDQSYRAIRPLVTVVESGKDLGISLTEMQVISKQDYGTPHEGNLKISASRGLLSGIPTVVSEITNVSNQTIVLNQVLLTGAIALSHNSTMTIVYADAIGCSTSHREDNKTTCPYPSARYEPVQLSPNKSFVSYFSNGFTHKLGPINKITISVWYDKGVNAQRYRTEIDYALGMEK